MTNISFIAFRQFVGRACITAVASFALSACASYYQVTDNASGKSYYTKDVDHDDGHVRFKDEVSGDDVSLDSSEVSELTEQQYENAVRK